MIAAAATAEAVGIDAGIDTGANAFSGGVIALKAEIKQHIHQPQIKFKAVFYMINNILGKR